MNERILSYLKEFAQQLQKNLQNFEALEELLLKLEEEGLEAQLSIDLSIEGKFKKENISPVKTKFSFKTPVQNQVQFILSLEDLDFLRSIGIEPLKKEKSIKK